MVRDRVKHFVSLEHSHYTLIPRTLCVTCFLLLSQDVISCIFWSAHRIFAYQGSVLVSTRYSENSLSLAANFTSYWLTFIC